LWWDVETLNPYIVKSVHDSHLQTRRRHRRLRSRYEFQLITGGTTVVSSLILRRAPPIPPTSVYVYVWDRTAPVPPEFSIAKYSSHLGMANRMIASRSQHGWDSRPHTAISDRNSRSCAIAYPRSAAAKSETLLGLSKFELRRISNT